MKAVSHLVDQCIECGKCARQCTFLQEVSSPSVLCKDICQGKAEGSSLNGCTLCGLCMTLCPQKIDIVSAFLEIKRSHPSLPVCRSARPLLRYQQIQSSKLLAFSEFPPGCDTVFFPGCSFATTRPQTSLEIFSYLQNHYPQLGVVLSCCGKPSHDLGQDKLFAQHFSRQLRALQDAGISRIITTCPNCQYTFDKYSKLEVRSIFEVLAEQPLYLNSLQDLKVAVHDSCTARHAPAIHVAIRAIISAENGTVVEMAHNREKAICCGDGAGTNLTRPDLAEAWQDLRHQEFTDSKGDTLISYCAGCSDKIKASEHILDIIFRGHNSTQGTSPPSNMMSRYWGRFTLKRAFQKIFRHRP